MALYFPEHDSDFIRTVKGAVSMVMNKGQVGMHLLKMEGKNGLYCEANKETILK